MENHSRDQLINTYLMAYEECLADAFIHLINQELLVRNITLQEVNNYYMKFKDRNNNYRTIDRNNSFKSSH